ncbi:MAG: hypothetical protein QOJ51_413, partial [Acidobacteriaceae bacterium]|nr:hypothetical protein [Acidobacteriaceae bacterium]
GFIQLSALRYETAICNSGWTNICLAKAMLLEVRGKERGKTAAWARRRSLQYQASRRLQRARTGTRTRQATRARFARNCVRPACWQRRGSGPGRSQRLPPSPTRIVRSNSVLLPCSLALILYGDWARGSVLLEFLIGKFYEIGPVGRGCVAVLVLAEGDVAGVDERAHGREGGCAQAFGAQ